MHNKAVFDYWHLGLQQQILHALTPTIVKQHAHEITRHELISGKLLTQSIIESLLMHGTSAVPTIVVAPYYASNGNEIFFPLLLQVELSPGGKFVSKPQFAMPIIPHYACEPYAIEPISLGSLDEFDNYMVMDPPAWLDDKAVLSWETQLNYAVSMLDNVASNWRAALQQTAFELKDAALVLPVAKIYQQHTMSLDLLERADKIETIAAQRNSGKSTYIKQIIASSWIEAAVTQSALPRVVWLEHGNEVQYASIFECISGGSLTSNSEDLQQQQDNLIAKYNAYTQGQQCLKNWREVASRLKHKYADKGGIQARLNQLHNNIKEAKAHKRHIQVLHSIWTRQLELLVSWAKVFDFIPFLQHYRLHRLYVFFKQNFPNEKYHGLKQRELEALLMEKLRRAENSERFVADALHQAESDAQQEQLLQDKWLEWCLVNNADESSMQELWQQMAVAALQYWHTRFNLNPELWQDFNKTPKQIDLLIVEHSEYVSPMQAAELFAISKRAIVMGDYNPICVPRFSTQIDYELTKHFELAECDADFEDLQYDGMLASVGNMWNMVVKTNEPDRIFENAETRELHYEIVDIANPSEAYLGSRCNPAVLDAVLEWLNKNATLRAKVAIYTCFGAQAKLLKEMLQSTFFAQVPIRLVQQPCINKTEISLFVPVYSIHDKGPYVFDRGGEILDNLLANTLQRLVIVGDMRIFKPELHSAAGNFAKLLFKDEKQNNKTIKEEEVTCV